MSEMVERVAESLRASMPGLTNPEAWPWKTLARAAIEAMREPTEDMADAGAIETNSEEDAIECWKAMIEEALR